MNRETAKKLLPLIQAFADGKEIETREGSRWEACPNPCWYGSTEYRVKPEPKKLYIIWDSTLGYPASGAQPNKKTAEEQADRWNREFKTERYVVEEYVQVLR